MANKDFYFGLRPVRHLNGNPWNGAVQKYCVLASYTNAIGIGEAVIKKADGCDATGIPYVDLSAVTATSKITGVVCGFAPIPGDLSNIYRKTGALSADRYVYVCDDPSVVYEIQCEGTFTQTMCGLNALLIRTHTVNTTTGVSGTELDCGSTTAPAADATYQVTILRLAQYPDNSIGEHSIVEVIINLHSLQNFAVAGV